MLSENNNGGLFFEKSQPIEIWRRLIYAEDAPSQINNAFRHIYEAHMPLCAEIIFSGSCTFRCRHCFYHADYSAFNQKLSIERWKKIIADIYQELNIRTIVHGGRSLDKASIDLMKWIKKEMPDFKIGIIDNGVSIIPYLNDLMDIKPDWVDISIDGLEYEHDLLRNRKGAFAQTLDIAIYLKENKIAPKINILSCLTTINRNSIIDMIRFMNVKGFRNFFIAPVSTFKDTGPSETLKLSGRDFVNFIHELHLSLENLRDTWVELNIFGIDYISDVADLNHELWCQFRAEYDHLSYAYSCNDNELYVNYHPLSLNGISEFIVNCNGDAILPNSVRKGLIPAEDIIGSLITEDSQNIFRKLRQNKLEFFIKEFLFEQVTLKGKGHCI